MPAGSRARRVAPAALALVVAALLLGPATPARAILDSSADADCPAASGLPQVNRNGLDFTGSLSCYRPGARGFGGTATRATDSVRTDSPTRGESCMNVYYYPVTFAESDQGDVRASFHFGDGTASAVALDAADAARAATYEAMVAEAQVGTYQPSSPSDPSSQLTCSLDPAYHSYCPTAGTPLGQACYIWVLHRITPATSPRPDIGPYIDRIVRDLRGDAGTIGSAPTQTGVVNTAVCFWIDGMTIPIEHDLVLTLPGPPDASGRQIFYTYLARITFQGVDWNFDDPHGNDQSQPAAACGAHPQITAHRYPEISDDINPDHRYHVTAEEHYAIAVDVYWIDSDSATAHHESVDPGVRAPTISPPDHAQYVGQVEGIPVGG